jgi:DNA primase catalytic core
MPRLPEDLIEKLKRDVPLSDLCRERGIELSGTGKNLLGKCPFHADDTASLSVTPATNLWNCLAGCGGGDTIALLMRLEGISFRRACDQLAARLGYAPEAATVETKLGTTHDILTTPETAADDAALLQTVADFYARTFWNDPRAMTYLQKRKCFHPEAAKLFQIGYANRTLGYRVPTTTAAGNTLKSRLQALGVMRKETGHEHLSGSVVFPICDPRTGHVVQLYGRKITEGLRKGTPLHLYLERPKSGLWNGAALATQREIILCESVIDALTFWCAGFRNVTCTHGAGSVNDDLIALLQTAQPRWVILAQDNDPAGNDAAAKLSARLAEMSIGTKRLPLPPGCDVNAYACQSSDASRALASLLEEAKTMAANTEAAKENEAAPTPETISVPELPAASLLAAEPSAAPASALSASSAVHPTDLQPEIKGDDLLFTLGDRLWRIRGLAKNLSFEALRVQVRLTCGERFHLDTRDLLSAKQREAFLREAAAETHQREDILKRDLGRILLKLEDLQEANIRRATEPQAAPVLGLSAEEHAEAMALLTAPDLMQRLLADFDACGVIGEDTNKLVGYLAATSRKFERPLGVIIQSTSAAGKTTLMEAVLDFMPEEERVKYSALTGQALFYLGETDIAHKILAIAEEEGAERATYALKLLQSEGELTIASTGKDATTGRMETQEYHVQGPAMIFFTTTSIEIDEELANRCLVLTVDESREQTRRIHELQREEETIEGHLRRELGKKLRRTHQNAQRLIAALPVHNPFAQRLTFPDENTRLRRDQKKYLTLIRTIALLHQHQRPRRSVQGVEHVEVTLDDIATANRLAGEVLGRSLDEMPPQTRRFLELLWSMVQAACTAADIEPKTHRFTQRDARAYTNWSSMQVKRHLGKLAELEYLLTHRGGRGQSFVYELLYAGEGTESSKFLLGLFDPAKLAESTENARPASDYDDNRGGQNDDRGTQKAEWGTSGAPQGHTRGTRGAEEQNGSKPSKINGSSATPAEKPQNAQPGKRKNFDEIKVVTPAQGAAVATTNHELPTTN